MTELTPFVLLKDGYYYRQNLIELTGLLDDAGIFHLGEVSEQIKEEGVTSKLKSEACVFSPGCFK